MKLIEVENKKEIPEVMAGFLLDELEEKEQLNILIGHGVLVEEFLEIVDHLISDEEIEDNQLTFYVLNYTNSLTEEDQLYNDYVSKYINLKINRPEKPIEEVDLVVSQLQPNGAISLKYEGFTFEDDMQKIELAKVQEKNISNTLKDKDVIDYGYQNILKARKIFLMTQGKESAKTLKELFEGYESTELPVTNLFMHNDTTIISDEEAVELLD